MSDIVLNDAERRALRELEMTPLSHEATRLLIDADAGRIQVIGFDNFSIGDQRVRGLEKARIRNLHIRGVLRIPRSDPEFHQRVGITPVGRELLRRIRTGKAATGER